jgi:hypothetical protein
MWQASGDDAGKRGHPRPRDDEQNVENLRKKYPWWLGGLAGGEADVPARVSSAEMEDVVTLFKGKSMKV